MTPRIARFQRLLPVACMGCLLLAAACVPTTAAYLSIPIETTDGESRRAVEVRVPLAELAERMGELDPETLTFYAGGRTPIPHQLVDDNGDGAPDAALVVLAVAGDGSTRLVALCPGPAAQGSPPPAERDPGVLLRIDLSRH